MEGGFGATMDLSRRASDWLFSSNKKLTLRPDREMIAEEKAAQKPNYAVSLQPNRLVLLIDSALTLLPDKCFTYYL